MDLWNDVDRDSVALAVQLQLLLLMLDAAADAAAAAAIEYVSQLPSGQSHTHTRDDLPSQVANKLTCIDVA